MKLYAVSKSSNSVWPGVSRSKLVYLGPLLEDALLSVGTFRRYTTDEEQRPDNPKLYSALPPEIEREVITFYRVNYLWISIERFEVIE